MTVPSSSIKMSDIRNELGLSGPFKLSDAEGVTLNNCASGGSPTAPHTMDEWAGYNHSAAPATPSAPSVSPGSGALQDSQLVVSWPPQTCVPDATGWDLWESSTGPSSGFTEVATGIGSPQNRTVAADTQRWYKLEAHSNLGNPSPLSSATEGRTCPLKPQSVTAGTKAGSTCADYTIEVNWSNGTSPGVRNSVVKWRVQKNGGGFGAWNSTAQGATTFDYAAGSVVSETDDFDFELYYDEESSADPATVGHLAICFT